MKLLSQTVLGFVAGSILLAADASAQVGNIPPGSTVNSAFLTLYVNYASGDTINVHRVTAPWNETTVTWNSFGNAFAPAVAGSFVSSFGYQSTDLTGLVQSWVNGSQPNYGIMLEQSAGLSACRASEFTDVAARPKLDIFFTPPGGTLQELVIQRPGAASDSVQDAYIYALTPDTNSNDDQVFSGLLSDAQTHSLIRFAFTVTSPGPGTGTPAYWVTHPCSWPVNSVMIGGQSNFWLIAVLRMLIPVGLDKSRLMYDQLVAAKLNVLSGNDSSCIAATIAAADAWMTVHPYGSGVLGSSPAWAVGAPLAAQLQAYNAGQLCAPPMN